MTRAFWARIPPERQRFIRFAIVGASGVVVNLGFVAIGRALLVDLEDTTRDFLASALGILTSIFSNFLLNDMWTWGDRRKGPRKRDFAVRLVAYYVGAGFAAGFQFGTFALLYSLFGVGVYLAQLVGIGIGTIINYVINNRLVFRDQGGEGRGDRETS